MARLIDILENFPFKVDEKKPTLIRKQDYSMALYPPDNAYTSDNTYTIISIDTFTLGIYELAPGSSFDPMDIHPGDESYYILKGPVVQRSGNGQFAYLETGDGLYMPQEAWHKAHNFSNEIVRVLYFIAPKAWGKDIPPKKIPTDFETKFYKGPNNDNLPDMRNIIIDYERQGCTDDIGAWPVPGPVARKAPQAVYAVRDANKLNCIHGTKHPMLIRFITSNDYGHFGEFILPAGGYGPRCSEPDSHKGDAAIYCLDGPVTINLLDRQESYQIEEENTFFIPANTKYQLINFQGKVAKCIFAITSL